MIVDHVAGSSGDVSDSTTTLIIIYFLMTLVMTTIFRVYGYFTSIKMVPSLRANINNKSFSLLLKKSYSYYQNNFSGSLTNKVNDLSSNIPEIIEIAIIRFLVCSLALIGAVIILSKVSIIFAISLLIWSIACISGAFLMSKKFYILADRYSESVSTITGKLADSLSNILSIRLFARDKAEGESMSSVVDKSVVAERKLSKSYFIMWLWYGYSFVIVQAINLYVLLKGYEE